VRWDRLSERIVFFAKSLYQRRSFSAQLEINAVPVHLDKNSPRLNLNQRLLTSDLKGRSFDMQEKFPRAVSIHPDPREIRIQGVSESKGFTWFVSSVGEAPTLLAPNPECRQIQ